MTYRDRPGESPSLHDGDDTDDGLSPTNGGSGDRRGGRGAGRYTDAPWRTDPEQVDRYLAQRERLSRSAPPPADAGNASPPRRSSAPRLDGVSPRSRRPAPAVEPEDVSWPSLADEWDDDLDDHEPDQEDDDADNEIYAPPRRARSSGLGTSRRTGTRRPRPARTTRAAPQIKLPRFVSAAALVNDRTALSILGVTAFGVLIMWAVFAGRIGSLPSSIVLHVDASGIADRWGPPKSLWRIPLLATMLLLMNLVVAWFVAAYDRFASRFVLAAALGVQIIIWVAAVRFLW